MHNLHKDGFIQRLWQKKAIALYDTDICDLSSDHVSISQKSQNLIYHIQELGYDLCPLCHVHAPIVNMNVDRPHQLTKMCDCGYEAEVNKPELIRAYKQEQ